MDYWVSKLPTDTNLPTSLSIINFNSCLKFGSVPSANEVFLVVNMIVNSFNKEANAGHNTLMSKIDFKGT